MTEDFLQFVSEHNCGSDQIRDAYYQLLEGKERDGADEPTRALLAKMKTLEADGFPINLFARMIEYTDELESSQEKFFAYVTEMHVSEKEKRILRSIVEKHRSGRLEFFDGEERFAGIEIRIPPHLSTDAVARQIRQGIMEVLEKITPKNLAIMFEER